MEKKNVSLLKYQYIFQGHPCPMPVLSGSFNLSLLTYEKQFLSAHNSSTFCCWSKTQKNIVPNFNLKQLVINIDISDFLSLIDFQSGLQDLKKEFFIWLIITILLFTFHVGEKTTITHFVVI